MRKEGFSGITPSSRNMGFSSQKTKKWALRCIGFCIGPVGCPCFVLEGLVLEAARDTLQLIAHSKEKNEMPPAYGYSLVTFFNLASTKLEDAVLDADTHTGRVGRQSEVSNNRPTIYLLDCEGLQASQHSH